MFVKFLNTVFDVHDAHCLATAKAATVEANVDACPQRRTSHDQQVLERALSTANE